MASSPPAARCSTLLLLLVVCAEVAAVADRASEHQKEAKAGAAGGAETQTPPPPAAEASKDLLARWPSAAETLVTGGVFAAAFAAVHLTPIGVPVITAFGGWGLLGTLEVGTSTAYLLAVKSAHASALAAAGVSSSFFLGARLVEAPYFEASDAAATPALPAHDGAENADLRRRLDEEMAHSARHRREAAAAAASLEAERRRTAGDGGGAAAAD
eukprot:Rhum_TRINITY_DN152_c0_g1::Rhum_TRINITY_DN152_c0_g1_i1::g.434::m.434